MYPNNKITEHCRISRPKASYSRIKTVFKSTRILCFLSPLPCLSLFQAAAPPLARPEPGLIGGTWALCSPFGIATPQHHLN